MFIFDVLIAIVLAYALYKGFKQGILVQVAGLFGVILGVFCAYKFASHVSKWFDLAPNMGMVIAFVCIFLVVLIALSLGGKLLKKLFSVVGLGAADKVLGAVLSALKFTLIIGALVYAFDTLNDSWKLIDSSTLKESILYEPLIKTSQSIFSYITFMRENMPDINMPDMKLPEKLSL